MLSVKAVDHVLKLIHWHPAFSNLKSLEILLKRIELAAREPQEPMFDSLSPEVLELWKRAGIDREEFAKEWERQTAERKRSDE